MAEVKNSFLSAKMNKDLDDRLIPNGEYRDALNIQVGKSESSDIGTVQPIWGNAIPDGYPIEADDTMRCIGAFMDERNNRIYQFLTNYFDPSPVIMDPQPDGYTNKIVMFDLTTSDYRVLVSGTFLNLATNPEFSITGLNLLENLLFWTDNRNQPRKINIESAISNPLYYTNEVQISVAKYAPLETIEMYRKLNKVASDPNVGNVVSLEDVTGITKGMQLVSNNINGGDFAIVVDVDTINNEVTLYERLGVPFANGIIDTGDKVTFLASTMSDRSDVADWPGDPDFLQDRYVRFSYRYKFDDGEYSLMAPFTQIAYIPNQKGYFIDGDENEAYRSTVVKWVENNTNNIELLIPFPDQINSVLNSYKITELDILYKESDSLAVKVVETVKVQDISTLTTNIYTFPYQSQKPYKTLPEEQTVRVYDRVPVRARAQETVSNRVVYGNYRDKYFFENTINYNTAARPKSDVFTNFIEYPNHTLKQNRTYQVGFVLADKFGRQSSVILSEADLSTVTNGETVFGGSTVYAPFIDNEDILFPGTRKWFGNALSMVVNTPLNSNKSTLLGQSGLYANPVSALGFAIRYSNTYSVVSSSVILYKYEFELDSATWPDNVIVPSEGQYLRGKYKDYVEIILPVEGPDPIYNRYTITTDGPINDLYNYNPEFSAIVPDIKYSYTINEIGWYSYKVVVRQQEQNYYNVYLPGILNGYPELQTYGSQLTYSDSDGIELATTASSLGIGWSGASFATGYTHAAGNIAPLEANVSAIPGSYYSIQYTITGSGVGNTTISFGGADLSNLVVGTNSTYIRAITTNTLEITPANTFAGTITLSLKLANASLATNQNGINTTNFPVGETNRTAHVVLINDNINKIPRDLSEVGPDQKQYRSSVNLFGRVQNKSVSKGNIIGDEPLYDSVTTTINYDTSTPGQGTAWQTVKPGDSIQCVEANEPIPGTPPLSNPNKWYANTVVVSNVYNPATGKGVITYAPPNTILKGPTPAESYVTFPVYSSTNEQYFPTTKADIATSIANALDFSFLDNSLENILGSAGVNFYQLQTNPIMSRISTKSGIGVVAGDVMLPFLAVYETKAEESLLDIFWESSTTGYISDLNWDVLTGFEGPVAVTLLELEFYEDQYDGGEDGTGDTKSPYISDVFTALNNQDIPVLSTTATMAVASTAGDVTDRFVLEDSITNPSLNPGEYRIRIATLPGGAPTFPFVFNYEDPLNEVYTFTITFSYQIPGSINDYTFLITDTVQLGNAQPVIEDGAGILIYNITSSDINIDTLAGVNGAYTTSANQEELYWEIVTSDDSNKFSINNLTGALRVADGVQLEDYDSYEITVRLTDATTTAGVNQGTPQDLPRWGTSLFTVAKVVINVLPPPVNSEIKPYITENNFLYNQSNTGGTCSLEISPTGSNTVGIPNVKYGVVYVGKEPLLNNTSGTVLGNTTARNQLPATPTLGSFAFGTSTTRNYQKFVNIETAVNIQNGASPLNLPATVGFKEGTLRWTVVLGGTTSATNGTIQEASLLAYLWRRPAATNNQPNTAPWSRVTDDNNVFDTGTINSNFPDRYKSNLPSINGGIVQNYTATGAAGKYGENFLAIKLDCAEDEKGFRMTSFTTTAPQDGIEYEWALTLVLTDTSTGCTAPLDSVGANAMVYVHDANFYYDGTWGGTITPTNPPKFIFSNTTPITNDAYEYKTGMKDTIINGSYTRATPYLNSIPFHLQDNRTRLEFDSFMYKVETVTGTGPQTINFKKIDTYQNFVNFSAAPNIQKDFNKNPNMSPGMGVYKVGITKSPSDTVLLGYVDELIPIAGQPSLQSFIFTPSTATLLAPDDVIIIKQDTDAFGSLWARTKFGNSIRQLYTDSLCTIKWQPPVKDRFYVVQTRTNQNIEEVGVDESLLLGKVSNNPLYCMNLGEKGKVYVDIDQGANVKFNVQTCWDAGLFTDLDSTFIEIFTNDSNNRTYREVWATKNFDGTTFRDGTIIPERATLAEWNSLSNAAWCHVNGDPLNNPEYGKLYNWYAAVGLNIGISQGINNRKNLAPYGWRVPPISTFEDLRVALYYGTASSGNGNLKPQFWREIGTKHWNTDTAVSSNNISGFTAFGAGDREVGSAVTNGYLRFKESALFYADWTATLSTSAGPNFPPLTSPRRDICLVNNTEAYTSTGGYNENNRKKGASVRFIKENMNTPGVYGRPLIQYLGVWDYDTVLDNG
jgi:hypothetical protein